MRIGNIDLKKSAAEVCGAFTEIDGEQYYIIEGYDAMQPFFISIASDCDLWMYLSSSGGLTCGRMSPDKALFPYYTDDKITEGGESTGSRTIMHVAKGGETYLWEPFSSRYNGIYNIKRSIAKSTTGNKIIFIEKNEDLGLEFSYQYMSADRFGWIKRSSIKAFDGDVKVQILDGLQNILPAGTNRVTQNTYSTLVDAYKKTELVDDVQMVLFRMESIMVDRAEPSESLSVNTVWCYGLQNASYLCSSRQLDAFREGSQIEPETESKGVRGAIFANTELELTSGQGKEWYFIAEVAQDAVKVRNLIEYIKADRHIEADIIEAVNKGSENLRKIVATVDGVQHTADKAGMARHFANTLFNTMRGGFYCDDYNIDSEAFTKHIEIFNKAVAAKHSSFLDLLPKKISYSELEARVLKENDNQLTRLFREYLPLTFSRRHGDPSRPWNLFSIRVNDEKGNKIISYQGNWRDIFQNWEALSLSYPEYINGIIAKFLNATTVDGYNPYKVTSEGIDWEVINPDDPWSNIGYWGDHQIIYLEKLLEISKKYYPSALQKMLGDKVFAYANVPYRFKSYAEIVKDPRNSLIFDEASHNKTLEKVAEMGSDARLVLDSGREVHLATFTEKILVTLLAKLSNFIPEAGVWMNTLRPEWNDANNALVGCGTSMVTLYYMRRFIKTLLDLYTEAGGRKFEVSVELNNLFSEMNKAYKAASGSVSKGFTDAERRAVIDAVGIAAQNYRDKVYKGFSCATVCLSASDLCSFFEIVLEYIDESIKVNKREDGLYNAYNIVEFTPGGVKVKYLYPMLEGQVAVLSALQLNAKEVIELLDSMRASALYRADQNSYTLYPNKRLATFLEKNNIPAKDAESAVIKALLSKGSGEIVAQDLRGGVHFNAAFNNAEFLKSALAKLGKKVSADDARYLLDLYERMFNHQAFTGRSGTFYKYEGLGSIYWHMVSKLLLAVAENIEKAVADGASASEIKRLKEQYADIKAGIGAHKSPKLYGSFPFDAYSHTPLMAGAQQPGMTGQVKEDIITRFFELGVEVSGGVITFKDYMLDPSEFIDGKRLSFTYCGVPFEYNLTGKKGITVTYPDGSQKSVDALSLDAADSNAIFGRTGKIKSVKVNF